jgi:hypothetical protein
MLFTAIATTSSNHCYLQLVEADDLPIVTNGERISVDFAKVFRDFQLKKYRIPRGAEGVSSHAKLITHFKNLE